MKTEDVLLALEQYVTRWQSQSIAASELGVSAQYLSDVRRKRRAIGPKILTGLGFKKSVEFIQQKKASK